MLLSATIIAWMLIFAIVFAFITFFIPLQIPTTNFHTMLPALVICPLTIYAAMYFLNVDLIFPPFLLSSIAERTICALIPSLIVGFSSGLFSNVTNGVRTQLAFWQPKPFVTFARATGRNVRKELRSLVLGMSLTEAFLRCLPLLFGELFLVEVFFSAPGLGHDLWHAARTRNHLDIAKYCAMITCIYGGCYMFLVHIRSILGARLQSYL